MNGIERLLMLREENDERGEQMRLAAPRFAQLAKRHIEGTAPKAVTGFNLFQTPPRIAAEMADLVRGRIHCGTRVLEPSAGLGRLYKPLEDMKANWLMVEEAGECVDALVKAIKGADIRHRDFLDTTAEELGGQFDAVVMNPPFKQGRDVKHILHALGMVKPGGRLVSLCYNGTKQREALKPIASEWRELPENSFREEGTVASVALLVIDKE